RRTHSVSAPVRPFSRLHRGAKGPEIPANRPAEGRERDILFLSDARVVVASQRKRGPGQRFGFRGRCGALLRVPRGPEMIESFSERIAVGKAKASQRFGRRAGGSAIGSGGGNDPVGLSGGGGLVGLGVRAGHGRTLGTGSGGSQPAGAGIMNIILLVD